jgi:hypothetical protein
LSARREFSRKLRREIVDRARNDAGNIVCEGCGLILGRKPYEIDHIIPEALIVNNAPPLTAEDGQLLGKACCHRGGNNKTAGDVQRIRKSDRQRDKHTRAMKPSPRGFRKPPGTVFDWRSGRYVHPNAR